DYKVTGVQTCALPIFELHVIKNSRPADSAPCFARLARFSFNWRDPSPENVKSSCSPRHKTRLWEGINKGYSLLRPGSLQKRKTRSEERRVGKECRSRW